MNIDDEMHPHQKDETISLAELSRQYLQGNMNLEAYISLEKQLTTQFGEPAGVSELKAGLINQIVSDSTTTNSSDKKNDK